MQISNTAFLGTKLFLFFFPNRVFRLRVPIVQSKRQCTETHTKRNRTRQGKSAKSRGPLLKFVGFYPKSQKILLHFNSPNIFLWKNKTLFHFGVFLLLFLVAPPKKCFVDWTSRMFFFQTFYCLRNPYKRIRNENPYTRILQKNPLKQSFKRILLQNPSTHRILEENPLTESFKRIIQKNRSNEWNQGIEAMNRETLKEAVTF